MKGKRDSKDAFLTGVQSSWKHDKLKMGWGARTLQKGLGRACPSAEPKKSFWSWTKYIEGLKSQKAPGLRTMAGASAAAVMSADISRRNPQVDKWADACHMSYNLIIVPLGRLWTDTKNRQWDLWWCLQGEIVPMISFDFVEKIRIVENL